MPSGPQGQKRPADVVGCAVHVAKIATSEIEDVSARPRQPKKANGGRIGGARRAKSMTSERRSEIAQLAAQARWQE